ncbi:hypothetical protein P7C70_g8889, partial [Phenoliferia sp. Uapishka_3]
MTKQSCVAFIYCPGVAPGGEPSFLLVSSRKHPGKWMLSKGGIKPGEDAKAAAEREANEEGGYKIGSGACKGHLMTLMDPDGTQSYAVQCLEVSSREGALDDETERVWREKDTRQRKWVDGWAALEAAVGGGQRREKIWGEMVAAAKTKI